MGGFENIKSQYRFRKYSVEKNSGNGDATALLANKEQNRDISNN
jgi:hypothetical protein